MPSPFVRTILTLISLFQVVEFQADSTTVPPGHFAIAYLTIVIDLEDERLGNLSVIRD
jgi:hypothetical protein